MSLNIQPNTKLALLEAVKEVARWLVAFIVSWLVTETLKQIVLVPEFVDFKVWVFTYSIPFRAGFQLALTFIGRAADKFVHEWNGTKLKGLLPF